MGWVDVVESTHTYRGSATSTIAETTIVSTTTIDTTLAETTHAASTSTEPTITDTTLAEPLASTLNFQPHQNSTINRLEVAKLIEQQLDGIFMLLFVIL